MDTAYAGISSMWNEKSYNALELSEKRQHRRLNLRLPLEFDRIEAGRCKTAHTMTENVSTGGIYFETTHEDLNPGEHLALTLNVPYDSRFPLQGQISTISKVLRRTRIEGKKSDSSASFTRYGIAVQFQQPLKLSF
jgi:hypothetical protein